MKNDLTVDSMLTEVKKNLSKYESLIKECESNPSKKKISEAESSKKKIEQKIKLVKTIIKTEDDNFMLESYEDLKNELNKRLNDSGNLEGVPVIGKLLKGKGALFCCVAIIFIIGFYVIFFKKNNSDNDNNS